MIYLTGSWQKSMNHLLDAKVLGVLNTPRTNKAIGDGWVFAIDNGCFNARTYVGDDRWFAWMKEQPRQDCLFAVAPDVVEDHAATVERSSEWLPIIRREGFRAAFVLQDGACVETVPWDAFDVAFVGGSDAFKLGGADQLIAYAKSIGKWVHVGRVNSQKRFERFAWLGADSCDGTFLAFGHDANLPALLAWVRKVQTQPTLWDMTAELL